MPNPPITLEPFVVHAREHRDIEIGVVIDADFRFSGVKSVQTPGLLGERAFPRDRHRQEQCVKTGVIEPLSQITACGHHYSSFLIGYPGKFLHDSFSLPRSHPAFECNDMPERFSQLVSKHFQVFCLLSYDNR